MQWEVLGLQALRYSISNNPERTAARRGGEGGGEEGKEGKEGTVPRNGRGGIGAGE